MTLLTVSYAPEVLSIWLYWVCHENWQDFFDTQYIKSNTSDIYLSVYSLESIRCFTTNIQYLTAALRIVGNLVLILDGSSEVCAHVYGGNLCYRICFRHFIISRTVTIWFKRKKLFSFSELSSDISTLTQTLKAAFCVASPWLGAHM